MGNLILHNKPIRNIAIIDDREEARNSMSDIVQDAGFCPIACTEINERSLGDFISRVIRDSDGAVFDYDLSLGGYANFDGAEAVVNLYDKEFPAILLTQVQGYDSVEIVSNRKKIPYFIDSYDVDANQIYEGFERCVRELKRDFPLDRRPYKTIARVESIDLSESHRRVIHLAIPAWDTAESVSLPYDYVYDMINTDLQSGMHLVAEVNIGAERYLDLFVDKIEVAKGIDSELSELSLPQ